VTSREIDEAAARLALSARDPKRDLLAGNAPPGVLTPARAIFGK